MVFSLKKMQKVSEKQIVMLKWIKPPEGVMKINVDDSMKKDGSIGAGGLIRDSSGTWCGGFMINLGAGDTLQSEAWGIFSGLQLALRYNHPIVQLESDSVTMINLLLTDDVSFHPLGTVIKNCKLLCYSFQSCSFIHIHKEKNIVADILAKASLENEKGIIWLDEVPAVATDAMLDDIAGVAIMCQVDVVVPHMSSTCDASPSMQPNTHDAQNPANGSTQAEAGVDDVLHSHMFIMPIPSRHHGDMNTTNAASFCSMTTTPTQHDADGEMIGL